MKRLFGKLKSKKSLTEKEDLDDDFTVLEIDNAGEYIVQKGHEASGKGELTVKANEIVSDVKFVCNGWLKGTSNGTTGLFPTYCVKKREDDIRQRKYATQVQTKTKHNNKVGYSVQTDNEARQLEEVSYETFKIFDTAKAVHGSSFREELQIQAGLSTDHMLKAEKQDWNRTVSSDNDEIPTEQRQYYPGSLLNVRCIDKKQMPSYGNEQSCKKDSRSTELLNTPVENELTKNDMEEYLKKPLELDGQSPDMKTFIALYGLTDYFPDKMQVRHVMTIERSVKPVTFKDIVMMFVRNIIMINLNGRDRLLQENLREKCNPDTSFNSSDDFLEKIRSKAKSSNSKLNPLDLTIAVFRCSSPMLKNVLASKFFICQLAIPFAFPSYCDEDITLSLIPLYSIVIECTSKEKSINEKSLDCPCHVVSFVRFGILSVSKSKLMNEILNDLYHSTFFDRDCPLGSSNRCISEGLIEVAWYLPSRKLSFLSCVTTFFNLRGDANRFQEQLRILANISSILVILIDTNSLDESVTTINLAALLDNERLHGIIIAIDAKRNTSDDLIRKFEAFLKRMKKYREKIKFCILKMKEEMRSSADIKKEMRECIRKMIDTKPLSSISYRLISSNLKTQEDIGCYHDVQQQVKNLWGVLPDKCANVKNQVIPVQGKPWKAWTKNQKAFQNSSLYKNQSVAGAIQKEMIEERKKQVELCQKIDPFMKTFIDCLENFVESENKCHVFVMLVKDLLDGRSRQVLPQFKSQYLSDWCSLKLAKEQQTKQILIDNLLAKAQQSEKELSEASFGFEHLCRELAQMFEALSECTILPTDQQKYVNILPKIAARLLLMGQPFELMDGDVTNVPMVWIKAVFHELKKLLGDKKMLSLSVLGIQSSGKSTLLNTMFGFQFAVSAGRCTRGVYAQLMPVTSGQLPFEYILVIDTEGLRALELADLKNSHDNELATFVVGLGDIIIVNVKGENTTEVKDVLQIVVHAFLRLRLANRKSILKQRCIFAHQNVPAQDAIEKMRHGRQKFIETLDLMTKEAAVQEKIVDIQTFNQVIQLDIEKDIWYFSDLWRGDPPMAPANPGYSETVADALSAITERLIIDRETYLTITDTVTRIQDLWSGILTDDFVFSFRNSLEFKAYNDMERYYHSLTWRLEQSVQEFLKVDAYRFLITCDNQNYLEKQILNIFLQLSRLVNDALQEATKEMNSFIRNNGLKDIMIQWQQDKQMKFKCFGEELITLAKLDAFNFIEESKVQKKRLADMTLHEHEINRQAELIAVKMKGSFRNKDMIQQAFNKMWNGWISQFDTKAIRHIRSIKEQIELLIHNRFPADVAYLKEVDQSNFLSDIPYSTMKHLEHTFPSSHINKEHYSIHSHYLYSKSITKVQFKVQIIVVVDVVFRKIDSRLSELQIQDTKFYISFVSEILNMICDAFDDHNENKQNRYHFNLTNAFRACVCSHVKRYLSMFFETLDEKYNQKHSQKAVMEEYKGTVWKLFTNTVESKTEDAIAVDLLRDVIIKEMVRHIFEMMPIDVQSYILGMYPFRKIRLIKDILTDLAKNEDFSDIKAYIQDPLVFSTKWIKDLTNKTLFHDREDGCNLYANFAKARIQNLFPKIAKAISEADEACKMENHETISQWIDFFVRIMNQNKIPISNDKMVHVKSRNVSKLDSFIEILKQQLEDIKNKVTSIFEKTREDTVLWDENPVPKIMLKLWGCSETCMFCKEPCINTDKDHVDRGHAHKCLQHRPQGIGGYNLEQTSKLCVAYCNHLVGTEQTYIWNRGAVDEERRKFREYKKHFPDWDIPHSLDKCQFWMWIMCKYKDELIEMYCADLSDIPESWPLITKQQALESLSVYMAD